MTNPTTHEAAREARQALPAWAGSFTPVLPYHLVARMVNAALTAQVQFAYACAIAASETAERAASCIEGTWPDTPLRAMVADAYRLQARERARVANDVLSRARQHCGLAFAAI